MEERGGSFQSCHRRDCDFQVSNSGIGNIPLKGIDFLEGIIVQFFMPCCFILSISTCAVANNVLRVDIPLPQPSANSGKRMYIHDIYIYISMKIGKRNKQ